MALKWRDLNRHCPWESQGESGIIGISHHWRLYFEEKEYRL